MRLDSNYVRLHVVHELERAPFATVRHDDFDVTVIDLSNGQAAAIRIMEREVPLNEILWIYRDHQKSKLHTVFLLWCEMLVPDDGEIFEPPDWLLALHTLHHQKIYAYKTVGDEVSIFPVYLKRIGRGTERIVNYGKPVDVRDIGCAIIDIKGGKIAGRWLMADFPAGRGRRNASRHFRASMDGEQKRRQREYAREHHTAPPVIPANPMLIHYRVLGVKEDAGWEEIKRAYHDLARKYHPDLNPDKAATRRMQEINAAYAVLIKYFDKNSKGTPTENSA